MSLVKETADYFRWLTTTSMSIVELNSMIKLVEKGMVEENWQVKITGSKKKIRKMEVNLIYYPNGENGENGGNHNGNV